jgi:hypothetical protein
MTSNIKVRHRSRPVTPPVSSELTEDGSNSEPSAGAAPEEYEVGYKKPPTAGQFKPGQSGNPKGRPKGSKNLRTVITRDLDEMVTIRENGTRRSVTKREVVGKQLVKKAIDGDYRAIQTILKVDDDTEAIVNRKAANQDNAPPDESLERDDVAILAAYDAMVLERNVGEGSMPAQESVGRIAGGGKDDE